MCNFKSGIILRDRVIVAPGEDDSHERLLESLGIEDSYIGASKIFVRAELVPYDGEWWKSPSEHPELWRFVVDQDILPDWFDAPGAEIAFRRAVCEWWEEHVLVGRMIEVLDGGYYRLRRCRIENLCNDVRVSLYDSTVGEMRDSSIVGTMWDSSTVGTMWDSSTVGKMRDSSKVGEMWGSSKVGEMWGSSTVGEMRGSSKVGEMWGSSTVGEMWGSSTVGEMRGSSTVGEMRGSSTVGTMWDSSTVGKMRDSSKVGEMRGSSIVRNFKDYPRIKIIVPDNRNFELMEFMSEN